MTTINLGTANEFIARHIGPRAGDEQAMLNSLGFDSLEALSASVIPDSIKGTSGGNFEALDTTSTSTTTIITTSRRRPARRSAAAKPGSPCPRWR